MASSCSAAQSILAQAAERFPTYVSEVPSFIGLQSVDVLIDESEELSSLITEVKELKDLPFEEKLHQITQIAANSMRNGIKDYDQIDVEKRLRVIHDGKTLSLALKEKLGCCRSYAALFLVLAEAAELGSRHYLETVDRTCFNRVVDAHGVSHSVYVPAATYLPRASGESERYFETKGKFDRYDTRRGHGQADVFLSYEINDHKELKRYKALGLHEKEWSVFLNK